MVTRPTFPHLDVSAMASTRDALHAYAKISGALLKACRSKRKHWWHASLRPSLRGLSTGVVYGEIDFELEFNLLHSRLWLHTNDSISISEALAGQPAGKLATTLNAALAAMGAGERLSVQQFDMSRNFPDYSREQAVLMQQALTSVAAALAEFRAGIREETSPIQLWPHHFDLSMVWLPGTKVPGIDPADEETADKQMNFGFTFGDAGIAEPYFYITAYPMPEALPGIALPGPARWHSQGFNGAVLRYADLRKLPRPEAYLRELWAHLLAAGRTHLAQGATSR